MAVKLIICIKKKPGMSREDFISYYEGSHVVQAKRLHANYMVKYVRNYPKDLVSYHPESYDLDDAYDAITEMVLRDEDGLEEMRRVCNLPENAAAIIEDEERFQDRTKTRVFVVDSEDTGVELLPTDVTHRDILPRAPRAE